MIETAADLKENRGRTKAQLQLMPPAAMLQCCKALSDGASKYGAFNWRDKVLDKPQYMAAILRHVFCILDGEEIDQDSGLNHLSHIMATCAILLDNEVYHVAKPTAERA